MSGSAVIICAGGSTPGPCLYFKSPIDRDRFRFPLTRPNWLTNPPALVILFISISLCGLWSKLSASVFPPARHITARESPAFATVRMRPVNRATTAVAPAWIAWSGRLHIYRHKNLDGVSLFGKWQYLTKKRKTYQFRYCSMLCPRVQVLEDMQPIGYPAIQHPNSGRGMTL